MKALSGMDCLPVEFISCRELDFEFIKNGVENQLLLRCYDRDVFLAKHLSDFIYFLFASYLNDDFHI
jgi:hypothetical protein